MKMDEATIERILRQTPPPSPAEELYERLKADLPAADSSQGRNFVAAPRAWLHRLAVITILMSTLIASGAGVYLVIHPRFKSLHQIPDSRLHDVAEPYIPHPEDLQPIPLVLHDNILALMQEADKHQAVTGQKTRWTTFDIQTDGTNYWWTEESLDWMAATGYKYHTSIHPNDFDDRWNYNLDGTPVLIKDVKPHYKEQWKPGDVKDGGMPVSDGYNKGDGYLIQMNKPKGKITIMKTLLFERSFAKPLGGQWKVELKNVQFGGAQHIFMAIKLPIGAKVVDSSRPFKKESLGSDDRKTLWFDDDLIKNGNMLPLTLSYSIKETPKQ